MMIQFIAPADQTWIIQNLAERLPSDTSASVQVSSYHSFYSTKNLQAGYVVFTGLGVLTRAEKEAALAISKQIELSDESLTIMNHPASFLNRYELLKTLYEKDINQFRAFQIHEIDSAELSYPVFIREAGRHSGSLTGLLHDFKSVQTAIEHLFSQKYLSNDLLVVEYCHTADENGLFRKYSAQKMGDAIVPRYLTLDYHWVVKEHSDQSTDRVLYDRQKIEEEVQYIRENPHKEEINHIFEIAGIDFGRIDYGFKNGNLQVWEINTLPTFGSYPGQKRKNQKRKKRVESKTLFYEAMGDVVRSLTKKESKSSEYIV
ncbi:MAG: hypothetical protein R3220_13135, partial [Balneolaceae bacterium]|nr:hypothetical protein [Balneolaceae bacterium]